MTARKAAKRRVGPDDSGAPSQAPASGFTTADAAGRSSAEAAARVLIAALLALAIAPPLLVGAVGIWIEGERAQSSAQALATLVRRELAMPEAPSSAAAIAARVAPGVEVVAEVGSITFTDQTAQRLYGHPDALMPPRISATREIAGPNGSVQIEVARSLAGALLAAASCALLSVGMAALLWRKALRRPLDTLRRAEALLGALSRRDVLTGLHNRNGLRVRLSRSLERNHTTRRGVAVLIIDVDRFRLINQSLGHKAGDQLLCGVADRIRAVTRMDDVVARLGSDQFAVLVEGAAQPAHAMARNLLRANEPAYLLNGQETIATLSIGIALAGESASGVDELLTCAETAARAAKAAGGGRACTFDAAMQTHSEEQLTVERQLRQALLEQQFSLAYQPIADLGDGRIVGVEALIRWNHPTRGVVAPAEFVPLLEQNGLIVPTGRWVLEKACRQFSQWVAAGAQDLTLSVNVSPRQFAEPDFVDGVLSVLTKTHVAAHRLQLEVTEGLLLDPSAQTLAKLDALATSGIKIAVDDFGMGYSSLAYLKRFRLNALKIDRVFVHDMTLQQRDAAIVRAIIDLGHGLGLHVTAEGVETSEQFHHLRQLGCDWVQGYLIAQPLSEGDMASMLSPAKSPSWHETRSGTPSLSAPLDWMQEQS